MNTTVSEKGQITIPKPLRDRLGIKPGEILECQIKNGSLIAKKKGNASKIDAYFGYLKDQAIDVDEYLNETRGKYE